MMLTGWKRKASQNGFCACTPCQTVLNFLQNNGVNVKVNYFPSIDDNGVNVKVNYFPSIDSNGVNVNYFPSIDNSGVNVKVNNFPSIEYLIKPSSNCQ